MPFYGALFSPSYRLFLVVEPGCTAFITKNHNISIVIGANDNTRVTSKLDPIQLSIFSHRFMSIAEQVGSLCITVAFMFTCGPFSSDGPNIATNVYFHKHQRAT
jgi:5-oxoprolinase (ATP-hydrolysing)